jgi:hypothetical protein
VCADKRDVKDLIVPVRYLAKLLHGPNVDYSLVQVGQLLPHLAVLLQHLQDRVSGSVEGKSTLQPRNAAKHAACLLRVLGLPEVQAVLAGQQQPQELLTAVQAAQHQYEAMHHSSEVTAGTQPYSNSTAADTQAQVHVDAVQQQPALGAGAGAAAAGTQPAAGVADNLPGTAGGFVSVKQLSELFEIHKTAPTTRSRILTTVKQLLQLVHGEGANGATVQLPSLLQQWHVLEKHLLQRMEGPISGRLRMQPVSARYYATSVLKLLDMPQVSGQLSSDAFGRLREQLQAALDAWKPLEAAPAASTDAGPAQQQQLKCQQQAAAAAAKSTSEDDSTCDDNSSSSEEDYDYNAPRASAGAAAGTRKRARRVASSRLRRRCALKAAAAIAVQAEQLAATGLPKLTRVKVECTPQGHSAAQVAQPFEAELQDESAQGQGLSLKQLQQLAKQQLAAQDLVNKLTPLRNLAKLLHGAKYDPDMVQVADLLRRFDVLAAHLVQRVAAQDGSTPVLAFTTALGYVAHVMYWIKYPAVQAQLSPDELQQVQDRFAAAKGALGQAAASKTKGRASSAAQDSEEQQGPGTAARSAPAAASAAGRTRRARTAVLQVPSEAAPAAAPAQVSTPVTPAAASQAVVPVTPAVPATFAAVLSFERDLLAAQRQLLWLYSHKLTPGLSAKVALRSRMQMLAGLTPGDIRLDRFWADYDVSVHGAQALGALWPCSQVAASGRGVVSCDRS